MLSEQYTQSFIQKTLKKEVTEWAYTHPRLTSDMMKRIWSALHCIRAQGMINAYSINNVDILSQKGLREIDGLSLSTKPGDPIITQVMQNGIKIDDRFSGIVVSTDGKGNGVVFTASDDSTIGSEVQIRLTIQLSIAVSYIRFNVVVEI